MQGRKATSLVTGLEEGKKYSFKYWGIDRNSPILSFTFDKDLHQIIDLDSITSLGD